MDYVSSAKLFGLPLVHVAADHVAIGEERRRRERRTHLQKLDVTRNRPRKNLAADDRHNFHDDHRDENESAGGDDGA